MGKQRDARFIKVSLAITSVLVLMLLALGTSGTPANAFATASPTPGTDNARVFTGQVEGSQAFIALAITGNTYVAFVCDGTTDAISFWQWFKGDIANNSIQFTAPNGEVLTAQIEADTVTGTVTLGDHTPHKFAADHVTKGAGLYRTEFTIDGVNYVGGWIVLNDGQLRGGTSDGTGKKKISSFYVITME